MQRWRQRLAGSFELGELPRGLHFVERALCIFEWRVEELLGFEVEEEVVEVEAEEERSSSSLAQQIKEDSTVDPSCCWP